MNQQTDNVLVETKAAVLLEAPTAAGASSTITPPATSLTGQRRRSALVPIVGVALCAAAGYTVFQRVGTTANANEVTTFERLAGGFAAVGRTAQQPGFLLLSEVDKDQTQLDTTLYSNWLAGQWTVIRLETPTEERSVRLRAQRVILVDSDGAVRSAAVDWTPAQWDELTAGMDCEHAVAGRTLRCGQPFTDAADVLAGWPVGAVPDVLRTFVARHRDE